MSGLASEVKILKTIFDQGKSCSIAVQVSTIFIVCLADTYLHPEHDHFKSSSAHDVASLLKMYLRDLPEPLCGFAFHDKVAPLAGVYGLSLARPVNIFSLFA